MHRSIWRRALGALIVLMAVGASTLVAPPGAAAQPSSPSDSPILNPIVGLPACRASTLPANDDGSVTDPVPLGFTANFLGAAYDSVFVNNNGNVTLEGTDSTFTPFE